MSLIMVGLGRVGIAKKLAGDPKLTHNLKRIYAITKIQPFNIAKKPTIVKGFFGFQAVPT